MNQMTSLEPSSVSRITVAQGDSIASRDRSVVFTTVLGSCIAVCLFDAGANVGGMNHFLLADPAPIAGEDTRLLNRYGLHSMELLINAMLKRGATRRGLRARIFGGATMRSGLGDIGNRNIEFARRFLANEGIPVTSEDVGGTSARRVDFRPAAGLSRCRQVQDRPVERLTAPCAPTSTGDVDLF
jgi:chemotaxis protein CheD